MLQRLSRVVRWSLLPLAAVVASCGGGGNNCFPAGTKIQTPGGGVAVETLKVGDEVLAYDFATGKEVTTHVVQTYVHTHDHSLDTLSLTGGRTLVVTPEHPLYSATRKGWVKAGDLAKGEELLTRDGKGAVVGTAVADSVAQANDVPVYNLETAGPGNYFAEGVLAKYY